MLAHNDLRKGTLFIYNSQPYEVMEYSLNFKGRGNSVVQTKIKNLVTGNVISQNFKPSETFEEAELERVKLAFVYSNRDKYVFENQSDKSQRIELTNIHVGAGANFLKQGQQVDGLKFNNKIINISLPIKITLKVIQSPPAVKGDRAESGYKQITLETGAVINAPLFVKEGDNIEINTQTNEYVRRVE